MTLQAWLTIGVILVALAMFITEVVTVDLAALVVLSLLLVLGLVEPEEGISGFSNPATITVLCMFILSAGIERTGLVDDLGRWFRRLAGQGETWTIVTLLLVAVPLSAFVNNTAAVALLIPLAVSVSREKGHAPSRILIPLSFGSIVGGLVTVIGTSTNLLGSSISEKLGFGGFGMFEFAAPGAILALVAVLYIVFIGHRLLPERGRVAAERFGVHEYLGELTVQDGSPLVGRDPRDRSLRGRHQVEIVRHFHGPATREAGERKILVGDVLLALAERARLREFAEEAGLHLEEALQRLAVDDEGQLKMYEVVVTPGSSFVGRRVDRLGMDGRGVGTVVAVRRRRGILHTRSRMARAHLNAGDALLVVGTQEERDACRDSMDIGLLEELGAGSHRRDKAWVAVAVFAGVVAAAATGLTSILVAAVVGATLMAVLGVLKMDELHRAIRWDVLFLLAGLIPLGIAVQRCGLADSIASLIERVGRDVDPLVLLILTHFVAMAFTEVMSNNATVVLLAPIAGTTAASLGLDPRAFILVVCFASSMSFLTPFGYQTNAMVYGPGGYRFSDYARSGWPLSLTFLFLSPWLISRFFPLVV
jgi:di/tricarboxylate transporter